MLCDSILISSSSYLVVQCNVTAVTIAVVGCTREHCSRLQARERRAVGRPNPAVHEADDCVGAALCARLVRQPQEHVRLPDASKSTSRRKHSRAVCCAVLCCAFIKPPVPACCAYGLTVRLLRCGVRAVIDLMPHDDRHRQSLGHCRDEFHSIPF